jgi:hypothetical protein
MCALHYVEAMSVHKYYSKRLLCFDSDLITLFMARKKGIIILQQRGGSDGRAGGALRDISTWPCGVQDYSRRLA